MVPYARPLAVVMFALLLLGGLACGTAGTGDLTVTPVTVAGVPGTVVLLSDLHISEGDRGLIERTVRETNALNPSLVLIAGDFVAGYGSEGVPDLSPLANIRAPVYAVPGNHDYGISSRGRSAMLKEANFTVEGYDLSPLADGAAETALADAVCARLEEAGVTVLRNEYARENVGNNTVLIVGLDDGLAGRARFPDDLPVADFRIVLLHEPEYRADWDADLVLCGHTHGGQVDLPVLGKPSAWFGYNPVSGLIEEGERTVYVSRGIGTAPLFGVGIRINCPPEITVFRGQAPSRTQ
ncbi:metallophosphoesterase [uncultured Methanofollis sp.]|uniref:metallophosphoesterase n=1 Tax=uncultured Methanofollis sp. TaxID=262500 RepID=UPI00262C6431|nr:metallophosphoesterase [uncultured Methanofollis sp.]